MKKKKNNRRRNQSPAKPNGVASTPATDPSANAPAASAAVSALPDGGKSDNARMVPRVISLIMLIAVLLLVTAVFFRVMLQFVAPLFLAGVLVVIFEPVHKRVMRRLPGRPQLAAMATTTIVAGSVIIPITWLGLNAFFELSSVAKPFIEELASAGDTAEPAGAVLGNPTESLATEPAEPPAAGADATSDQTIDETPEESSPPPNGDPLNSVIGSLRERASGYIEWYEKSFQQDFDQQLRKVSNQAAQTVLSTGVHTLVSAVGFLFGLGIMAFAMYYFLADGPGMVEAFVHLSPLDDDHERQLLEKFAEVSRAVVVATLLSAAAQGLLAGVGYYFALDGGPIFLLTAVTMLMAIVPFVGATIIWVPVVAWVYLVQGDTYWAIGLALWCAIVVSNIDNLIKPMVLHGQSNLHPLLALLSVMGGVSVLGPIGILVGPMLVAFLQALLGMLRTELDAMRGQPA